MGALGFGTAAIAASEPSYSHRVVLDAPIARLGTDRITAGTPTTGLLPAGASGSWHMIFDDEFRGSRLDTGKWSTGWFGSGITAPLGDDSLECFDPAQVSVGGELDVSFIAKRETCGGRAHRYASGIVTTNGKFDFTYGLTEFRAFITSSSGVIPDWPDLWTDGHNWPTTGENDIMEGLHGSACFHFHHQVGAAPGSCAAGHFGNGWHTFAADWERGVVTYYYDGKKVGRITQGITGSPMYLIISVGADHTFGGPVRPTTVRIKYVRVWQH